MARQRSIHWPAASASNASMTSASPLKRGESLGIIGPTGCGKSTIINLLMRFYDVEDGGVFVDGRGRAHL